MSCRITRAHSKALSQKAKEKTNNNTENLGEGTLYAPFNILHGPFAIYVSNEWPLLYRMHFPSLLNVSTFTVIKEKDHII